MCSVAAIRPHAMPFAVHAAECCWPAYRQLQLICKSQQRPGSQAIYSTFPTIVALSPSPVAMHKRLPLLSCTSPRPVGGCCMSDYTGVECRQEGQPLTESDRQDCVESCVRLAMLNDTLMLTPFFMHAR